MILVCDGWKSGVDPHVDGEIGVIAGPLTVSTETSCDIVEGWQGRAPRGQGNMGGGREAQGEGPTRVASGAWV